MTDFSAFGTGVFWDEIWSGLVYVRNSWVLARSKRLYYDKFYAFSPLKRIFVFSSKTVAHSLEIVFVSFVVILSGSRGLSDLILINRSFFIVMWEAVSLSFHHIVFKEAIFGVVIRWRDSFFILERIFIAIAKRSSPFSQGTHSALIIWCLRDVFPRGESVGFWEGVKLFESRIVQRRSGGFNEGCHCCACK